MLNFLDLEGLQLLLGVCADGQDLFKASPDAMTNNLLAARESLANSIANIDIMLNLLDQARELFK